ncbi:vacuolar-sorting protein snf7 [Coccidioides immitis H538.4]|uniref:Vacuolar-sorting protein snf7 n=1 Tax=Coccidioides immitis H538.4 TaxID=396776 RepID=A0A0J8S0K2_COCIT|nr:vacuolar-sorting protein snf7 [Coccidioides immitis H538.4]
MWSWFGGASAQAKKDVPKKAILELRQQLEMLQKREKYLEAQMAEQDALARKYVTSNKNGLDSLPVAANGELKGKTKAQIEEEDEEAELEKLKAEMAM